jgi:xanthine dehydrogenase accessory factor
MKIFETIRRRLELPEPVVVATVLKTMGSVPQVPGTKALLEADGTITDTLGGGIVEAEAQRRARDVADGRLLTTYTCAMDAAYARDAGPICGGTMWVMLDGRCDAYAAAYRNAADALARQASGLLVTPLDPAEPVQWIGAEAIDEAAPFPGASDLRAVLDKEAPRLYDDPAVFVEPIFPAPRLLIVGAGHVGQALAHQAHTLGFNVTVVDDRSAYANPGRFPNGVAAAFGDIPALVREFNIDRATYVVLVTKGHKADAEALEACVHAPAAYLGMIGSRRKVTELREDFLSRGLATPEEWIRIFAPIGLDIGAITVAEIATSIASQLVAVRRRGARYAPPGDMVLR